MRIWPKDCGSETRSKHQKSRSGFSKTSCYISSQRIGMLLRTARYQLLFMSHFYRGRQKNCCKNEQPICFILIEVKMKATAHSTILTFVIYYSPEWHKPQKMVLQTRWDLPQSGPLKWQLLSIQILIVGGSETLKLLLWFLQYVYTPHSHWKERTLPGASLRSEKYR